LDPDGKRLQIDDLIIIPNHLQAPPPEGGGSALRNLAMIASRYQNSGGKPKEGGGGDPKRPRMENGTYLLFFRSE
jgi:hypothetical protein